MLAHDPAFRAPVELSPSALVHAALPEPLTSFVGRKPELDSLRRMPGRLVTLVGPAGVGKTRLAIEWAHELTATVPVCYVELAPIDPRVVGAAIGRGLGALEREVTRDPPDDPVGRAIDRIRNLEVVLVLDNCEHAAGAVAGYAETLLAGCPRLRIVATSREPLGVDGEQLMNVDPLDLDSAGRLFVERARAVQPLFDLDDIDELAVLSAHLDGLPLAIELAAARTRTLPVPEITSRLHDRFRLLHSSKRSVDARHEGLEAAIDWSYEMLFDDERRTFRRLAVFSGGATSDAIDAVCGADGFEVATRLVNRSLCTVDTSGPEVRFGMLESFRDYGLARLVEANELEEVERAPPGMVLCRSRSASTRRREAPTNFPGSSVSTVSTATSGSVSSTASSATRPLHSDSPARCSCRGGCAAGARNSSTGSTRAWQPHPTHRPACALRSTPSRGYLAEPSLTSRWRGELEEVLAAGEREERDALRLLDAAGDGDSYTRRGHPDVVDRHGDPTRRSRTHHRSWRAGDDGCLGSRSLPCGRQPLRRGRRAASRRPSTRWSPATSTVPAS